MMEQLRLTPEEEQKLRNLLESNPYWHSRLEVGQRLVELSAGKLRLAPKKSYIAIQPHGAEHRVRRNAISLLNEGISFTVADWMPEAEARSQQLQTERGEGTKLKTIKRLRFPALDCNVVNQHLPFFTKLTVDAFTAIEGKS